MDNFIDDVIEPSNLEEYAALLEDKVKASLNLVDALQKNAMKTDKTVPENEFGEMADNSGSRPLILSL